jgi:hypothetical protein
MGGVSTDVEMPEVSECREKYGVRTEGIREQL